MNQNLLQRTASFCLLILVAGCAGSGSSGDTLSSVELPPNVEVTFNVLVPENTLTDDDINFVIVDNVTGISLNAERHSMRAEGERSFSFSLRVPTGSLVHYHYARLGEEQIEEMGAAGQATSSRIFLVDGPGHVAQDLVAAWGDLQSFVPNGQISGTLLDEKSGAAIEGILVFAGGMQTVTNEQGFFAIRGLTEGLHNLVATAPDGAYRPFQQGALVAADTDTPVTIQLARNKMIAVTFVVQPPEDSVPAVPIQMDGNLMQFREAGIFTQLPDGRQTVTLMLPQNMDIRYKYTLGDGFWNAEHYNGGNFVLRQLILAEGVNVLEVEDKIISWTAGNSEPIWFDLIAPSAEEAEAFIQFKLVDWTATIAMWPLGNGHFAYKLYSPTNFAAPLEYRYCHDAFCFQPEENEEARFVSGNLEYVQVLENEVVSWSD